MTKTKKIKIIIITTIIVILLILTLAFYIWNKNQKQEKEIAMKAPALDYFDKYMSANTGSSAYEVTLNNLKQANKEKGENYQLNKLKDCDGEKTKAIIIINYSNGKVDKTEIKLKCKII